MNHGIRWSLLALLLGGAIGCDAAPAPQGDAGRHRAGEQKMPGTVAITLQISGFQKSKSGAT